jgi:MFS family permease
VSLAVPSLVAEMLKCLNRYFGSMALLTQMTSERERPLYLNLVGITFGGGTVLGPIIGGAFAVSSATWRWGFYLSVFIYPLCMNFQLTSLNGI